MLTGRMKAFTSRTPFKLNPFPFHNSPEGQGTIPIRVMQSSLSSTFQVDTTLLPDPSVNPLRQSPEGFRVRGSLLTPSVSALNPPSVQYAIG